VGGLGLGLACGGADAGEAVDSSATEPVAGSFEGEDVGVVDDAVDHGGGDGLVAEDLAPANWDWLKLLLDQSRCDEGVRSFGVAPDLRGVITVC
jgi:hypothetical protein